MPTTPAPLTAQELVPGETYTSLLQTLQGNIAQIPATFKDHVGKHLLVFFGACYYFACFIDGFLTIQEPVIAIGYEYPVINDSNEEEAWAVLRAAVQNQPGVFELTLGRQIILARMGEDGKFHF